VSIVLKTSVEVELMNKQCSECNAEFGCGVTAEQSNDSSCWCMGIPDVMPLDALSDCMCQSCLAKKVGAEIMRLLDAAGSPKARLEIASKYKHQTDIVEHIDYTVNEKGLFVFSEWYHLKRARCCGKDCRHCVYK